MSSHPCVVCFHTSPFPLSPFALFGFPPPAAQSAEDRALKERLELSVERLKDENPEVQKLALELLRKDIRESTR